MGFVFVWFFVWFFVCFLVRVFFVVYGCLVFLWIFFIFYFFVVVVLLLFMGGLFSGGFFFLWVFWGVGVWCIFVCVLMGEGMYLCFNQTAVERMQKCIVLEMLNVYHRYRRQYYIKNKRFACDDINF